MRSLSFLILLFGWSYISSAQNPHGPDLKMNCAVCHTSDSWEIPMDSWNFEEDPVLKVSPITGWEFSTDTIRFNHYNTGFPLEGQHAGVDCRDCHDNLVFNTASTQCFSCHVDIHQQTVGADCARCHTSDNWLVDNIMEIHQENGFPLLGVHAQISCAECHQSETDLQFFRIGNECINCHLDDYQATTEPNHAASGFSLECIDCHRIEGFDWSSEFINHDFFPLVKGHDIADCTACHTDGSFKNTPTDCIACHQNDYNNTQNPDHQAADLSTNCIECHTLDPVWMPADYQEHDNLFPIYTGSHAGEWDACIDCHLNPNDFSEFTCTTCHERNDTDDEHDDVNGYVYESRACLACHPTGSEDDNFDHNRTRFPLRGAHTGVDCRECHVNGYAGTPTDCVSCHQQDYDQTTNPDHKASDFSTECVVCHTETAWIPAVFDHDNTNFPLRGAHAAVDCIDCHNDGYAGTPTDCVSCHQTDFDLARNPDHRSAGFPTDCASCHSEEVWEPANFDHDAMYFPIYSGNHRGEWDQCIECHTTPGNFKAFSCIDCHEHNDPNELRNDHEDVSGYRFESNACYECHPRGESD